MEDLTLLENKIMSEINTKFSSLEERMEHLIGLLDKSITGSIQRRPNMNLVMDDNTLDVIEPKETIRCAKTSYLRPAYLFEVVL